MQPSLLYKIHEGGQTFNEVIVKCTLVKKTPALQATWNRKYLEELRVITKKFLIKYLFSMLC